jgi:hypothetical protein
MGQVFLLLSIHPVTESCSPESFYPYFANKFKDKLTKRLAFSRRITGFIKTSLVLQSAMEKSFICEKEVPLLLLGLQQKCVRWL